MARKALRHSKLHAIQANLPTALAASVASAPAVDAHQHLLHRQRSRPRTALQLDSACTHHNHHPHHVSLCHSVQWMLSTFFDEANAGEEVRHAGRHHERSHLEVPDPLALWVACKSSVCLSDLT